MLYRIERFKEEPEEQRLLYKGKSALKKERFWYKISSFFKRNRIF